MKITISTYDDSWPAAFIQIRHLLESSLSSPYVSIEHIGSTSVPGLCAKPIIDIDIMVNEKGEKIPIIIDLKKLGYKHVGDLGIIGREAFRPTGELLELPKHNLYLMETDNIAWVNHRLLRDQLRANAEDRDRYAQLKRDLAKKYPEDIDAYIEGKSEFILKVLSESEMDMVALNIIRAQNKKPQ